MTKYKDKTRAGYKFSRVTGLPLTIQADESGNVIRVYYEKVEDLVLIVDVDAPLSANTASLNVGDCIE